MTDAESGAPTNIIPIGHVGPPSALTLKEQSTKQHICSINGHGSLDIDEANRLCHCRYCSAYVDPFDWLLNWAKSEGHERMALGWLNEPDSLCHIGRRGDIGSW